MIANHPTMLEYLAQSYMDDRARWCATQRLANPCSGQRPALGMRLRQQLRIIFQRRGTGRGSALQGGR